MQLFDMMVHHDSCPPAFVSKNSSGKGHEELVKCVNDVCGDVSMILYIISKKGFKNDWDQWGGLPNWAS